MVSVGENFVIDIPKLDDQKDDMNNIDEFDQYICNFFSCRKVYIIPFYHRFLYKQYMTKSISSDSNKIIITHQPPVNIVPDDDFKETCLKCYSLCKSTSTYFKRINILVQLLGAIIISTGSILVKYNLDYITILVFLLGYITIQLDQHFDWKIQSEKYIVMSESFYKLSSSKEYNRIDQFVDLYNKYTSPELESDHVYESIRNNNINNLISNLF